MPIAVYLYKDIDKNSFIPYHGSIFPPSMLSTFIHHQRTSRNLTQEYMASRLKMSRPTYMQIERGEREITVSEARILAEIFDLSLEDFLQEREEQTENVTECHPTRYGRGHPCQEKFLTHPGRSFLEK